MNDYLMKLTIAKEELYFNPNHLIMFAPMDDMTEIHVTGKEPILVDQTMEEVRLEFRRALEAFR